MTYPPEYPPEYDIYPPEGFTLTVAGFIEAIGVTDTLARTLRAIDRHNIEHVFLVLADGKTLYYHTDGLDSIPADSEVVRVGVGAIAWDDSDWEFVAMIEATSEWVADLDDVRERELPDALAEHDAMVG